MVDLEKVKARLEALKNPYKTNNILKLEEGNQTIRLLPLKDGDICKAFFLHYNIGHEGAIMCPKANFGNSCLICNFVSKLFNEGTEDSKKMAKNIMKKQRFFSPVLLRGKEKEGVKVWSYSKTVYEFILKALLNPENGDITDIENGTDIDIEYGKKPGKLYQDTIPSLKRKTSSLCKDLTKEECVDILENIPDLNKMFKIFTEQEIKSLLDKFLSLDESESELEHFHSETENKSLIDQTLDSLND